MASLLASSFERASAGALCAPRYQTSATPKITCRPNGPYLIAGPLQVIFDPLVPHPKAPATPGAASVGLGLFIAREIATGHGGTIEAASNDRSTSFTIRIPRTPSHAVSPQLELAGR